MSKDTDRVDGDFIGNCHCVCGKSSDAMSVYRKEIDGEKVIDAYCRSGFCDRKTGYISPNELDAEGFDLDSIDFNKTSAPTQTDFSDIEELPCRGWKKRMITKTVTEKYQVRTNLDVNGNVTARYYPVTNKGNIVGYKKRSEPKSFLGIGNTRVNNELFGQHAFEKGEKYLVIVTGEEDAMALAQTLKKDTGSQIFWTPVVSVTGGDGSAMAQIKANYEYVNSFEKVILMFDADESAQKEVEPIARLLSPGKAHIARLPSGCKDANEAVLKGLSGQLKQCFWKAERFSPIDICTLGQLWDDYENAGTDEIIPLPHYMGLLRAMMNGGPALGEITVIGALTSIGKSVHLNNIVYHGAINEEYKSGLVYLESSPKEMVEGFLSIHKRENLSRKVMTAEQKAGLRSEFEEMIGDDQKIVVVKHDGSFTSVDEMYDKIEWLARVAGAKHILLDPLQQAVPSNENGVIDQFMDRLLKLAKSTNTAITVVSHMRKPDGEDPHAVSEYSLKGSSSINQVAFNTILLSRDKTHENPRIRNSTKVTLVKCRRTGNTGSAGWIHYDPETGDMHQIEDPYAEDNAEFFGEHPEEAEVDLSGESY